MFRLSLSVIAIIAIALPVRPAAQSAGATKVNEQVLVTGEPGLQFGISPAGQHLAAVSLRGSRQVVVFDGVDGPVFDAILETNPKFVWSDDGSRLAYAGRSGQNFVIVVDGKEAFRGPWQAELAGRGQLPIVELDFTPGGKHWYAVIMNVDPSRSHYRLVIDGKPGPVSQDAIQPIWSPNGEHHAYIQSSFPVTAPRATYSLVVDGRPAPYMAGKPQFTGDSLHLFTERGIERSSQVDILADGQLFLRTESGVQLFMAPSGPGVLATSSLPNPSGARTAILLIGNKRVPGSECTDFAGLKVFLSADAKHWAASCQSWVMADGKKGLEYGGGVSDVIFTADGRAVYRSQTNGRNFLVVGTQESDAYAEMPPYVVNKRDGQVQLPALVRGNHVAYIAGRGGNNRVVVIDGKPIPATAASIVDLSPDGSRFAFLSGQPYQFATIDGTAYTQMTVDPANGNIGRQGTFQWTPDSKHVAWIVNNKPGVAIDGKFFATPQAPRYLTFSADGRHLLWLMRDPRAPRHLIFLDGEQVLALPANGDLETQADLYWGKNADGTIQFIAQDGDVMKRFTIVPGTSTSIDTLIGKSR